MPPLFRTRPRSILLAVILCAVVGGILLTALRAASASNAAPSVVAHGLLNPRGLAFGPDGALYVAEAGAAGPEHAQVAPRQRYQIGKTGRVSRVGADGSQSVVADGLPSVVTAHDDDVGPAAVAFVGDTAYVLTAAGGTSWGDPSYDNAILRLAPDGQAASVLDYQRYAVEQPSLARRSDPRADVPGGMPYGLTSLDGALYATDGNHEFVLEVRPGGEPRRLLEYPASNRVLTGITPGPDGALYVVEMGPWPFVEGTGRITRLQRDGQHGDAWAGLTAPVGVAAAPDGTLYALEFTAPRSQKPSSGRVLHRTASGGVEVVAEGLNYPTAIALGPDGALYVSVNGHHAADGSGEVVRLATAPDPLARLLQGLGLGPRSTR